MWALPLSITAALATLEPTNPVISRALEMTMVEMARTDGREQAASAVFVG